MPNEKRTEDWARRFLAKKLGIPTRGRRKHVVWHHIVCKVVNMADYDRIRSAHDRAKAVPILDNPLKEARRQADASLSILRKSISRQKPAQNG